MKKNLFTCFLALLCLFGSPSSAQSKVAESPREVPLHRSGSHVSPHSGDIHRGGDARPDTYPSELSLVDQHLDPGAGEGTSSFLAAPVTVLDSSNQNDQKTIRETPDSGSLRSPVFRLPSQHPSAQTGAALPAVILVETLSVEPVDSLEFRIWDPYLNELDVPKPFIEIAPLSPGSVFQGSWGAKTIQWNSPPLTGNARISIRNGRFKYLDRFLVQPGDSVRIRLDFQTAKVLFSGPAAEKFRSQYLLAQAIEAERFQQSPIMFTRTSDYWGHSMEDSISIANAISSKSSIHRSIEFVSTGESGLNHLRRGFSADIYQHHAWEVLDDFRDKLPNDFWGILQADVYGKLKYDQIADFLYLRYGMDTNAAYRKLYQDHILQENHPIPEGAQGSAFYIDYLFKKLSIISYMDKEPMVSLLTSLPEPVRDPVHAKYLIKNFRTFKDSNLEFEQGLSLIQTPWINELIGTLYHSQKIGSPLASIPLHTVDGDSLVLKSDDGKIRLIQFWLPGCQASANYYARLLSPAIEHFKDDPKVEFVFISNDPIHERWLENISAETYSSKESLNLNAPGKTHPYLMYYHIHAFPEQMVVGRDGGVVNLGSLPKTPQGLIEYLDSLKVSGSSTNQPFSK